jgi:hypothetical protein
LNIQPMFNLANEFVQPVVEVSEGSGAPEVVTEGVMQILQYLDGV